MAEDYDVGDPVRVPNLTPFTDSEGNIVDPQVVQFRVLKPSGIVTTYVYETDAAVIRLSAGYYAVDLELDQPGTWEIKVLGSQDDGSLRGADTKTLSVNFDGLPSDPSNDQPPDPEPGPDTSNAQAVRVGRSSQANFTTIASALDSITDASATNQYEILLESGDHEAVTAKEYVNFRAELGARVICTPQNPWRVVQNAVYRDVWWYYENPNGAQTSEPAAVDRSGNIENVRFFGGGVTVSNVPGIASRNWAIKWSIGNQDAKFYGFTINTESCGFWHNQGQVYCDSGCMIHFFPQTTGQDRYGVYMTNGARFQWEGIYAGTGYWIQNQDVGDNDTNMAVFYVPVTNTSQQQRLEIRAQRIYARKNPPQSGAWVNCVRMENGWARVYGGRYQVEDGGAGFDGIHTEFGTENEAIRDGGSSGGRVDIKNTIRGGVGPGGIWADSSAWVNYRTISETTSLDSTESGPIFVDATAGNITLDLGWTRAIRGKLIELRRIDATANTVTIDTNGGNTLFETQLGAASTITLPARSYLKLIAVRDDPLNDGLAWRVMQQEQVFA